LVISGIRMPVMNGIELASIIRRMNKEIPIILMTASSGIADVNHSILTFLNIKDVIAKPVKLKDLIEKVNTIKPKVVIKQ
jgi:CheY-like chemotaxis protein